MITLSTRVSGEPGPAEVDGVRSRPGTWVTSFSALVGGDHAGVPVAGRGARGGRRDEKPGVESERFGVIVLLKQK